jgi:hypothetical protein
MVAVGFSPLPLMLGMTVVTVVVVAVVLLVRRSRRG